MIDKKTKNETNNIERDENFAKISKKTIFVLECVICFTALALFLTLVIIAEYCSMSKFLRCILIFVGVTDLIIGCLIALYFDTKAGFHICEKCGHKHQPTYFKSMVAPHIGWTRLLKCPKCGKISWQKKRITKD